MSNSCIEVKVYSDHVLISAWVLSRAYILKKRACNSHSISLDNEILSVTKNSASGQLRLRETVCRLRDAWFIRVHPPPSSLRHARFPCRLVADNEE